MVNNVRKIAAVSLTLMVMFFTALSVLAIWDVIQVEQILQKALSTLLVIFISSAISLFIFAVLFKPEEK